MVLINDRKNNGVVMEVIVFSHWGNFPIRVKAHPGNIGSYFLTQLFQKLQLLLFAENRLAPTGAVKLEDQPGRLLP